MLTLIDQQLKFEGIRRRYRLSGLTSESLTSLAAGESIEDEFDIASTTNLAQGGTVSVQAQGMVPLVSDGAVSGYMPFSSNKLSIDVDGAEASKVKLAISHLDRRTQLTGCSGSKQSALTQALQNAVSLANKAAEAASSGSASKFQEYFKTTDSSTRQTVAARLQAVAKEASSTSSGATTYHCDDAYGYCDPNVLAYTLPSQNTIANCDIYYSQLPPLASSCHAQDQATTSLHEFTHAPGVYSPGTQDLGYGYQAATSLSANQALNNADSYALYANGKLAGFMVVQG